MAITDTRFLSLAAVSKLIKQREVSPVELTEACLDRIDLLNGRISAFITVAREQAMATAEQAAEEIVGGSDRGALHGVPIALKDLYATKGIRTTANSDLLADWIPDEDATTTRLLAEAGTVMLGKLSMNEFAFGAHDFEHQLISFRKMPYTTIMRRRGRYGVPMQTYGSIIPGRSNPGSSPPRGSAGRQGGATTIT